MANDKTEETVEKSATEEKESPVKKKRKLTSKQARLQNSINRLSQPRPDFSYMKSYYLPQKAVTFKNQ